MSDQRCSIERYHQMIEAGILTEDDHVELLEGYIVAKMPRNPPHDGTLQCVQAELFRVLPIGWDFRNQCGATLLDSEPEPDFAVVRGDDERYMNRHPGRRTSGSSSKWPTPRLTVTAA